MRPVPIAVLLASAAAFAQSMVDPARLPAAFRNLEPQDGEQTLPCAVTPIRPALNFGFRFQAGYVVRVPMNRYSGSGHRWAMLTRITPEGGNRQPVYLLGFARLPKIPRIKQELETGGGYLLGEGRYSVQWMLRDETGRVCRKHWRVEAKLGRNERRLAVAMPRDTASDFSWRVWADGARHHDDAPPFRLTVLLHAAPVSPRRTRLRASDRMMSLGLLSSLLERLPARSVRLVVFNLDQQKELFRRDAFSPEAMAQVAESINGLELATVDYRVLQNRRGPVDLLSGLVNQELRATEPSDVVLFLGPPARYADKVPHSGLDKPNGAASRFFYFQYKPYWGRAPDPPDSINLAVAKLKGKTLEIRTPGEFAKAIEQMERQVAARN